MQEFWVNMSKLEKKMEIERMRRASELLREK